MAGEVLILGGGVTGLSAGWRLSEAGAKVRVIEKENRLGGISTSFRAFGFTLDYGPHKIYTQMPEILTQIKTLMGEELLEVEKKSSIRLRGKYLAYPFKPADIFLKLGPMLGLGCGLSYLLTVFQNSLSRADEKTYEEFILSRFGRETYRLVFEPYARKVWGEPKELSAELARVRVVVPSMFEAVRRFLLGGSGGKEISAKVFYYPARGIARLSEKMAEQITKNKGAVEKNAIPRSLKIKNGKAALAIERNKKTKKIQTRFVISTIPLADAVFLLSPLPPENILRAARALEYRSLVLTYLIIKKERALSDSWIFFPEREFVFNRVSEQAGFSRLCCPRGKSALCAELTCNEGDALWKADDERIIERVLGDIEKADLVRRDEVERAFVVRKKNVYPKYHVGFERNLNEVLDYFDGIGGFITNGRQGLFNYNNIDHCMDMGFESARYARAALSGSRQSWRDTIDTRFENYVIID